MADQTETANGNQLDRRKFLKWTGVSAALVTGSLWVPARRIFDGSAAAAAATTANPWNHNPASRIGPYHWANIGYPVCGSGLNQSPVNIMTRSVRVRPGSLLLDYQESELEIENTGHYVEVPIPPGVTDTLKIGADLYQLVQYHFHVPSEHRVDGHGHDLEAHFVHQNTDGATAVVGVFFDVHADSNRLLDRILLSAPATAGDQVSVGEANPLELLQSIRGVNTNRDGRQASVEMFYAYDGSLTTPGCTENVRWSVLAHGGGVSRSAVARFHRLIARFPYYDGYPNNNRPVQALNGRVITLNIGNRMD